MIASLCEETIQIVTNMNLFTSDKSKSYLTHSLIEVPLINLGSFIVHPSL